jgi:hypothetical protein
VTRDAEYRLVGRGTAECRQLADGLARCGADGERATRGEGDLQRESGGIHVLSLIKLAVRFSLVRTPRAHPGGLGMAWALRMD